MIKTMVKTLFRGVLKLLYRVDVQGFENYEKAGDRVLIIANHLSFLDAVLLASFLPGRPVFAINTFIAERWWVKPFLSLVRVFRLDHTHPMAAKTMIEKVKSGQKCVIFPEGRITETGSLMKVYEGPGMIADKARAMILPVRLDGVQYSPFSRLKGKVRRRWFPKIRLTMLEPRYFDVPETLKGRKRRKYMSLKLYDLMTDMLFTTSDTNLTLFEALLDARALHGRRHVIATDIERASLTYQQLVLRSFILGRHLSQQTKQGDYVGVMLPNMAGSLVSFFALHAVGRVPAMLNFSAGSVALASACGTGKITIVLTARRFIEKAKLKAEVKAMEEAGAQMLYLEDIVSRIGFWEKIKGWAVSQLAGPAYRKMTTCTPDDAAVLLFTSGSEGTPKGVVLSHRNIQANCAQLRARIDFGPADKVFNALPVFHAFGLTGGTLLPVLSGIKVFFYPSPLHYRIVPELVYDTNSTVLFGTDTFLSGYARMAHAYDFYSIRYVFAGAEKLKEETRKIWSEKYGLRLFEGYGATETAPVIAVNTPMHHKSGSVGRILPGISWRLKPLEGFEEGGSLMIAGPNVMKGYLFEDKPGELHPPEQGWYDTGDIVSLDEEGFVTIKGRVKRFAKIGGEMVSLGAIESWLSKLWPDHDHAVLSVPDLKKGERLVLVTEYPGARREDVLAWAREHHLPDLSVPRVIHHIKSLPLLGTGKTDYVSLEALIEEL